MVWLASMAQTSAWDHRGHAPIWWTLAVTIVGSLLLAMLAWSLVHIVPLVLAIVAAVFGIRWLMRNTDRSRADVAVTILRERYACGDITREEFEAELRDLGADR